MVSSRFDRHIDRFRGLRWRQEFEWVGVPIAEALGMDLADPRVKKEVTKLISEWTIGGLLRVVEGRDKDHNPRDYIERV